MAAHSATTAVEDGSRARWYLLGAGLLLMAWAGIGAVRAVRVAARLAWGIDAARLRHPLRASGIFTIVGVAGLAASLCAAWTRHHQPVVGAVVTVGNLFVYAGLALFAFSQLPRPTATSWRDLWPGALLAGSGLTAVHLFVAYYLGGKLESSPTLYGTPRRLHGRTPRAVPDRSTARRSDVPERGYPPPALKRKRLEA